jgi:hypothetical protein
MYASGKAACKAALAEVVAQQKRDCKSSEYGCRQCLWASCECVNMSKYAPEVVVTDQLNVHESCTMYTYYD